MPKESKQLLPEARQRQRNGAGSIWDYLVAGFGVGGEEMDHFVQEEKNLEERARRIQKEEANLRIAQLNFRPEKDEAEEKMGKEGEESRKIEQDLLLKQQQQIEEKEEIQ